MEDNELFGERHEQEENGLYGKRHAELCDLHNVSNRRELLLCSCDNPDGFKEMEQGEETCSKCKKPY